MKDGENMMEIKDKEHDTWKNCIDLEIEKLILDLSSEEVDWLNSIKKLVEYLVESNL